MSEVAGNATISDADRRTDTLPPVEPLTGHQSDVARVLELILIPTVAFVLMGSFHLHFMLTAGDWDFWLDWKDREWWLTVTPVMAIMYCGALHYILWEKYRLPFGATLAVGLLLLSEWIVRYFGWQMWSNFPIHLVTPAYFWAGALILDATLLVTGSFIITGFCAGFVFGAIFWPANWAWLGAYHVPVESNGVVMTIADLIGYEYVRTGTPEYIRIIERGTLRTFGAHSAPVSAAFAGFLCIFIYWFWWWLGSLFSTTAYYKGKL